MNYKPIVINSYDERYEQSTSFSSYFKREALLAKRDNFVEFEDFFKGCLYIVALYENEITRQYEKELTENDVALHLYKLAIQRGETLDNKGEPIQKHIDNITEQREYIKRNGYKDNFFYYCLVNESGEISGPSLSPKFRLYWQDIEQIKQGILQAQSNLNVPYQPNIISQILMDDSTEELKIKTDQKRFINSEKLKEYFKPEFWKPNESYVNYFEMFISELETNRVAKEFAEIALMIYGSKYMNNRKPLHFSEWYRIFCENIDCEQKKYEPKDLRPPRENLLKLFNYLT